MSISSIDLANCLEKSSADFRGRARKNCILMHLSIVPAPGVTPETWASISKELPTFPHPFYAVEAPFELEAKAIASAVGATHNELFSFVSIEEAGAVYCGVVLAEEDQSRNVFKRKLQKQMDAISALLLDHGILGPYEVQCSFDFRKLKKKAPMAELTNGFSAVVDLTDKSVAYRFASEPLFS